MPDTIYFVFNSITHMPINGDQVTPTMIPAAGMKVFKFNDKVHIVPNVKHRPSFYCSDFKICHGVAAAKAEFDRLTGKQKKLTLREQISSIVNILSENSK